MAGLDDRGFYDGRWRMLGSITASVTRVLLRFLASVAGGGPALEVAIGTGRVALPLAARDHGGGRRSPAAMVQRLRAKPGGEWSTSPSAT